MTARPARRSLADAFRPGTAPAPAPDRAAGLGGLLPPRPAPAGIPAAAPAATPAQDTAPAAPQPARQAPAGAAPAAGEPRRDRDDRDDRAVRDDRAAPTQPAAAPPTRPDTPGADAAGADASPAELSRVRNVAVYLPLDLLDRYRRTARSRELTYADLLVEAAAAHLADLPAAFPAAAGAPSGDGAGGMPGRQRRRAPEPGVQVQVRLDGHQVRWLDEQAHRLGAPSRTALVAALLRAHLT